MSYSSLLEAFEELARRKRVGDPELEPAEKARFRQLRSEIEEVLFQKTPDAESDRREHVRVPVSLQVSYWSRNELKDRYVKILGEGGLFIATEEPLPVGTRTELEIGLVQQDLKLKVLCEVVFVDQETEPTRRGMGVKFVDLSWEQKAAIYDLVDDNIRQRLLERRQYTRLDSRLTARFLWSEGSFLLPTADLSVDGVFVATEHLLETGERAKMLLEVPGTQDPLRAVAEVIRVVEMPMPGLPAGVGLRFVMIDPAGRQAILDYMVERVANRVGPVGPGSDQRIQPRLKRRIPVRYRHPAAGGMSYSRDLSGSGIFIQTPEPPSLGSGIKVTISHPLTGQQLPMLGKVVRVVAPDPDHPHLVPGVGVVYDTLDPEQHALLKRLMKEFVLLEGDLGDLPR